MLYFGARLILGGALEERGAQLLFKVVFYFL